MNILQKSYILNFLSKRISLSIMICGMCILSIILGLVLGAQQINIISVFKDILNGEFSSPHVRIFLYVRLPRVVASFLCGCAFSVSGVILQAVLSNPLASPNIIGVNAGAGLFTFIAIAFFPSNTLILPPFSFFGTLFAMLLIYIISAKIGSSKITIVLSGVAVSSIFTAGINLIKTFYPDTLYNGSYFLIGGFSGVTFADISSLPIVLGLIFAFLLTRQIDVICLGEDTAKSLGMNISVIRFILIFIACVLAGTAVSFSGLIGFVGLIIPHISRKLFGTRHRVLIPASCFLGGSFVTSCDLVGRLLFAPYELPVGIIMSLLGGPFFIFLILSGKKRAR